MRCKSEARPIVHRVIHTIADAEGVAPRELSPLAEVIDPDALNALFSHPADTTRELRFKYEGYTVRIDEHGDVAIRNSSVQ